MQVLMLIHRTLLAIVLSFPLCSFAAQECDPKEVKAAYTEFQPGMKRANTVFLDCDTWVREQQENAKSRPNAEHLRYCAQGCRMGFMMLHKQLVNKSEAKKRGSEQDALKPFIPENLTALRSDLRALTKLLDRIETTYQLSRQQQPIEAQLHTCFMQLKESIHVFQKNNFNADSYFSGRSVSRLNSCVFSPDDIAKDGMIGKRICKLLKVVPESDYIRCNERCTLLEKQQQDTEVMEKQNKYLSTQTKQQRTWLIALGVTSFLTLTTAALLAVQKRDQKKPQRKIKVVLPPNELEQILESQAAR